MANERIAKTTSKAPETGSLIYQDLTTFIKNSQMQISFVTTSSTDVALETVRKDLEGIRTIIGHLSLQFFYEKLQFNTIKMGYLSRLMA